MEDRPSVERRLQLTIPRKPVGGHRNTLSVPTAANPRKPVNDDGVSLLSRNSFVNPEWTANFNLDLQYPGDNIREQGIPLTTTSAQETELRRNSYIPSHRASLVDNAERGVQPTHVSSSEREVHSAYEKNPRTPLTRALRWLRRCLCTIYLS